jgi:hypothetical protein
MYGYIKKNRKKQRAENRSENEKFAGFFMLKPYKRGYN